MLYQLNRKQSSERDQKILGEKKNIAEKKPTFRKIFENTIQVFFKYVIYIFIK